MTILENIQHMVDFAKQYQVLAGFLGASTIGTLLVILRRVPHRIYSWLTYFFTVELTAYSGTQAFDWLDIWLSQQSFAAKTRRITLKHNDKKSDGGYLVGGSDGKEKHSMWHFVLGKGNHFFWKGWRPIIVHRSISEGDKNISGKEVHVLTLTTIGRSQAFFRNIMKAAEQASRKEKEINVYQWRSRDYWKKISTLSPRSPSSIITNDNIAETTIDACKEFLNKKEWYQTRGIPYRIGFLFSGFPGTGKTSTIHAMASSLQKDIYTLLLSTVDGDADLLDALSDIDDGSIVVLEDIDAMVGNLNRDEIENQTKKRISLAALLNGIDGLNTTGERILVMTTNKPEFLDPALIRPGRIDYHKKFTLSTKDEVKKMFKLFYGEEPKDFEMDNAVSPAAIQGILIQYKSEPNKALEVIKTL